MQAGTLKVTGKADADALLNSDPLALLLGMLLDQQVPMEWAFASPHTLLRRLGTLDVTSIVATGPEALEAAICEKPALHRFPISMGKRAYAMCEFLLEKYPTGLKNDPTTHTAVPEVVVAKKAKKAKVAGKKGAGAEADTEAVAVAVAVAVTSVAPKTVEWITFLHEGKPHIRNTSDGKVYMCDLSKSTREDSVISENFVGRWTDGALDKFATEDDE